MKPTRTRVVAALAAAAAFTIPIVVSLSTTIPAVRRTSLGVDERTPGFPAPLRGRWSVEPDGTFYLLRIGLSTTDPRRLLAHQAIGIELLPYQGAGTARGGEDLQRFLRQRGPAGQPRRDP